MRRASTFVVLLALAVFGLPAVASAAPSVTLKANIVPIPKNLTKKGGPTWPNTGAILGAPARSNSRSRSKATNTRPRTKAFPKAPS